MDLKENFGRKLKKLRLEHGLTQEELAEKLLINPRQISKIETGDHLPSATTIEKICIALGILPHELFNFDDYHVQPNDKTYLLLKQIQTLIRDEKYYNYVSLAIRAIKDKKALHDLRVTLEGMELIM